MATLRAPFAITRLSHSNQASKRYLESLARRAGVRLNGSRPWDMQIHDERTFQRIMAEGSIGAGESYMDGWWDAEMLDGLFARLVSSGIQRTVGTRGTLKLLLQTRVQNLQSRRRSGEVARRHYDLSPELYRSMLDERMIYSCGYWTDADNLDDAQEAKLDLICRKLGLRPGMHLLDIGCGWGGAARFAAERYGVSVTGITVSAEQGETARETCRNLPVRIIVDDYRSLDGKFDRIMSIGMFEHVGYKNYHEYFRVARRLLTPNGLFLLHTIGSNRSVSMTDPWIEKYIFPNSHLPSAVQISRAMEGVFVLEDWHNFGADYDRTLMAWYCNFERHWPELSRSYDNRFQRMWRYYLQSCAGSFRARSSQLWQLVLSPFGVPGGWRVRYRTAR